MDFTLQKYTDLLCALKDAKYNFQTFNDFLKQGKKKVIVLRHDVDNLPENSLGFAEIQSELGIQGTYYFRIVPQSFNSKIIQRISDLGHEIGYHYETMDTSKGNIDHAYKEFCQNLEIFRKLVPIDTISMHGSPMSKFDNRAIWNKYDYKNLGLKGEPYFDIDFNSVCYITDTGRRWNGDKYNVRDKALTPITNTDFINLKFRWTLDIINSVKDGNFPDLVMLNFHPQRWHNKSSLWLKELLIQNIKNQIKRFFFVKKS